MNELRLPAIEVRQGPGRVLYSFAVDGKLVPKFATVSRVRRTGEGGLEGYQRVDDPHRAPRSDEVRAA